MLGLVPMGAVFGVFIASSTASGKAAFDGDDDHSPYTRALADALTTPGEKLEDVFKSVRRQVRLATDERQIPWESTSLELDFYFVPPKPLPAPAAQLLAAAKETGNLGLFDLLLEKFPDSAEASEARTVSAELRRTQPAAPAAPLQPTAALVLERARQVRNAEAYDLVAALFPGTPEATEAQDAAAKLREVFALDSAGPTYEGRELVREIRGTIDAARLRQRAVKRRVRCRDHSGPAPSVTSDRRPLPLAPPDHGSAARAEEDRRPRRMHNPEDRHRPALPAHQRRRFLPVAFLTRPLPPGEGKRCTTPPSLRERSDEAIQLRA